MISSNRNGIFLTVKLDVNLSESVCIGLKQTV